MDGNDREVTHRVAIFDGTNFVAWKFRMLTLLEEHELVECILKEQGDVAEFHVEQDDSADVKFQKTKALENRQKQERKCKSMLVARIHDDQLEHLHGRNTPKEMWDALVGIFERKSVAKRLHLNRQMDQLRYTEGSLQDHFIKFDRLIRLYRNAGGQMDDVDVVCRLLLSVGSEYDAVITSIESQPEDQLTMDFVKCRLLDEEIKRKSTSANHIVKSEAAAFSGGAPRKLPKKKTFKCFGCQKEGHKLAECPENKKTERKYSGKAQVAERDDDGVMFLTSDKLPSKQSKIQWFIDSGATEHICNDERLFSKLVPLVQPMRIAVAKSGEWVTAKFAGDVPVLAVVGEKTIKATVTGAVFIPEARCNLFSISKVEAAGMKVVFEGGRVEIQRGSKVVATGQRCDKLYELNFFAANGECSSVYFSGQISKATELWHRRYGHLGERNLSYLIKNGMVKGLNESGGNKSTIVCEACVAAKQTRNPFTLQEERQSSRVLELVHSDVCGPVTPAGWNGQKFFVIFIDDWSRFTMVYLIHTKDEVVRRFEEYEAQMTAKFGVKISRFRSDNGGEYTCKEMRTFCSRKGIKMEFTVPYCPEQNGTSERMNRTLVEKARSMMFDSGISREFWGEAVQTAAFLANRSPASAIGQKLTPYELFEGRKPDVSKLRVFGSVAYCHIPKEKRRKLDEKSWKGVFVGYGTNGYRVWNPQDRKIVIVRDAIINETSKMSANENPKKEEKCTEKVVGPVIANEDRRESDEESEKGQDEHEVFEHEGESDGFNSCDDTLTAEAIEEASDDGATGMTSSGRTTKPPAWFKEYDMTFAGVALGAMEYVENLPDSIAELKKRADWPKWQAAIQDEMDSLQRNKTWTLEKLPKGRVPISCKWVFRVKPGDGGIPDRYKARLVARGFSQRFGFDYTETYSPVIKLDTLRTMLAVANQEQMYMHQMDVRTAFLNGDLSEEIFMSQPEGFAEKAELVCRLRKSLYGLKQASKAWNDRFHRFISRLGFKRSNSDQCLYWRGENDRRIYLILYVDDILVFGRNLKEIRIVKACLSREFDMTDIGDVTGFLGMRIERDMDKRILRISQRRYLEGLLNRFNMSDCKPSKVPMECRLKLEKGEESRRTSKPYRELIGCLMYATLTTRPDLCASVNYYSQFQNCPTEEHWTHLKRLLRYIKGTIDVGLEYTGNDKAEVVAAYCDADWANSIIDRRSVTGYVFKVFGCVTTWLTRKQQTVSLSSTEAELVALTTAVCEGAWLIRLLEEVGYQLTVPVTYFEDNQSTIRVVNDPKDHGRLKHVDVKLHYIRSMIQQGRIRVEYIPSERQIADIMTKSLPNGPFCRLREKLNLSKI